MSGKSSFIIIGIAIMAAVLFVFYFSTPQRPTHVLPVGVSTLPKTAIDSPAMPDTTRQN